MVEADESDGSFLRPRRAGGNRHQHGGGPPELLGTAEAMEAGFYDFGAAIGARGGYLVVCRDDPGLPDSG